MKKIVFALTALLITGVIVFLSIAKRQSPPVQQVVPTPTPVAAPFVQFNKIDYSQVFQDLTIAKGIAQTLQNPIASTQEAGLTVVSFPTDVDKRVNKVYTDGVTAKYVFQEITTDNTDYTTFLTTRPTSSGFEMFDTIHAGSGFTWQVFPQDGIAFLTNKSSGYAINILYFPPTSKETFLQEISGKFQLLQTDPESGVPQETFQ